MSTKYRFHNPDGLYFMTFAVVEWVDVFTRKEYRDILVENLKYCQENKGLELFAWCIMSNHVHLIVRAKEGNLLQDILRDFKKYTSKKVIEAIVNNGKESRKEWMLAIFRNEGKTNSNNTLYQFWRQDNKPIEIYSVGVIEQKMNYLHHNPVWRTMLFPCNIIFDFIVIPWPNSKLRSYSDKENLNQTKHSNQTNTLQHPFRKS